MLGPLSWMSLGASIVYLWFGVWCRYEMHLRRFLRLPQVRRPHSSEALILHLRLKVAALESENKKLKERA